MSPWLALAAAAALGAAGARPTPPGPDAPPGRRGALLERALPRRPALPLRGRARPAARPRRAGERRDRAHPPRPLAAALRRRSRLFRLARGSSSPSPATAPPARAAPASPTASFSATSRPPTSIEAISYNEAAGRFEFQEIVGYAEGAAPGAGRAPRLPRLPPGRGADLRPAALERDQRQPGDRRPPRAARRELPRRAVRQTVDGLEAFDAATDRAAAPRRRRTASGPRPAPTPPAAPRSSPPRSASASAPSAPARRRPASAPRGRPRRRLPGPRQPRPAPRRDDADDHLETDGALNPETPRAPVVLWSPGPDGFAAAARAIAAELSPGDLAWIDALLRRRAGPAETVALACATTLASRCRSGGTEAALRLRRAAGGAPRRLPRPRRHRPRSNLWRSRGQPPASDIALPVARGARRPTAAASALALADTAGAPLTPDRRPRRRSRTRSPGAAARRSAAGPFPRAAVLALLADLLGGTDG